MSIDRTEASKILGQLVEAKTQLDLHWRTLDKHIGLSAESPFGVAVWGPIERLIECVSMLLDDELSTVAWFVWDNGCGKEKMQHSLPNGHMRKVESIDDLLDVLGF